MSAAKTWGGKRKGAGRKAIPLDERTSVAHRARGAKKLRHPILVSLRAREGLPSFRSAKIRALIETILERQRESASYREDFEVLHRSIQASHIDVIVRATDPRSLRSGVSGIAIAFAKQLNALLDPAPGAIWPDRYLSQPLDTPAALADAVATFRKLAK